MTKARCQQLPLQVTPYYHCVTRCVRHAQLCGVDVHTKRSFDHRSEWIASRLVELQSIFTIDLCTYSVSPTQYNVILRINEVLNRELSDKEVVERWHKLFRGTYESRKLLDGEKLTRPEQKSLKDKVEDWRDRLLDISWFLRSLNEFVSRQSNLEEGCSGRFWEGRFRSQALLDEKALLGAMAYVDVLALRQAQNSTSTNGKLRPKKMADSDWAMLFDRPQHSALYERWQRTTATARPNNINQQIKHCLALSESPSKAITLPFKLTDYLGLLEESWQKLDKENGASIDSNLLQRFQLTTSQWLPVVDQFENRFKSLVGEPDTLRSVCESFGMKRASGLTACQESFGVVH